jgi:hypothetical protein
MIANISKYALPGIGGLCVLGAISVGVAVNKPVAVEVVGNDAMYSARTPQQPQLKSDVPTMDVVLEKHLFSKTRKASGAKSFSDLLVKGVYVGEKCSVVLSLKSRPSVNLRIWQDNVSEVLKRITDSRDPRQTIVDFLNEWDVKEITMKGMTVEHFVTGEVETYEVDYVPTKHVADSAEAGYGQGALAADTTGDGTQTAKATTVTVSAQPAQGLMVNDLRSMMRSMTSEQRAAFAQRMGGGGGDSRQQGDQSSSRNSGGSSSGSSSRSSSSSSRNSSSSGGSSSGGRSR